MKSFSVKQIIGHLAMAAFLALIYNIGAGLSFSLTNDWPILELGAMYIDIAVFFLLILTVRFMRRRRPAIGNAYGPLAIIAERVGILILPVIYLNRFAIQLKVLTGNWYSFISFERISTYTFIMISLMLIYVVLDLGYELMDNWRTSEAEREKLKRLHTQAQFENLKAQVNPHFLFNSLNTLSSLIVEDEDRARQFVRQLSAVYRYILENREKDLISLESEKKLFDAYVYLCETRFEENLKVETQWPSSLNQWSIPPMTLQILVENAIKHNVISRQNPLHLWVHFENQRLIVGNTYQPRRQLESGTGFGLKNILERYSQLTPREVKVQQKDANFIVELPLIKST